MKDENNTKDFRSGYVSIIGRPNVGKSTLLNSILSEKVAIVTKKPQTTRNKIIGIKTLPDAQIIFIDTPGIHRPRHKLGEAMVRTAMEALKEVDIILLMVEPREPRGGDRAIIDMLRKVRSPVILLINKIDTVRKPEVLPLIEHFKELYYFKEIIPISALTQDGIDLLIERICDYLPLGPMYYPGDLITDQLERFMVSEIIREKIMNMTEEEIPHSVAVEVAEWKEREDGLISVSSNIYVEREGQKGIIIGKKGTMLKSIGSAARVDMEKLLNTKVFLELWVKVKKDWRDDKRLLHELGYR
ncbi:MAG: GTPase Era [Thermodesulfovibrio sp. RBG_19FT_COMBO_42_12]|nr:MAG: GTPase Era [Thermodesulfovibrio sp. RBG_19FT_COMBO_42_12]